jgi:PAS domain S-box-containing protein
MISDQLKTSTAQSSDAAPRKWLPRARIRRRLPFLIAALLFVTVGMFTWTSYHAVRNSALDAGGQRLQSLTQQLSNQFQLSASGLMTRTFTAANEAAPRAFLEKPSEITRSAAVAALKPFVNVEDQGSVQVELWRMDHTLALVLPEGSGARPANLDEEFNLCVAEPFRAVGSLRFLNDAIIYPVIAAVKDDSGKPLGYLVRWRRLAASPDTRKQLSDLLGNNASLFFGNTRGDLFSDLVKPVPPPPSGLIAAPQPTRYQRDGHEMLGLGRAIGGTPWLMVVELPVNPLLESANHFLRRMLLMGVVVLGLGLVGAILLSRNITRPLQSLTEAATAISKGDYSRKVLVTSRDELGELAESFNAMVRKTHDAQRELERKVQERTLQLEAAPCAMLMVDKDGKVTLVNAQAEQLFGYERSELLERPIEMLVPNRYRGAHPAHRKVFSGHPTTRAMGAGRDLYGLRKDGAEVPIEIGLNPIETEAGTFVLASIIDISERKRADERFRLVVEAAPSAMIMIDNQGLISLVNTQTERLFGYTRTELLGQRMEKLVPQRYRVSHPDLRRDFFANPSTRSMGAGRDLYGLRKDGSEMPIEIGLNPIDTAEGAFVLASIIDITERKRAESQLRQVIEHAPNGMVMVSREGKIAMVNAQIEKWFGYQRDELLGQSIETLVPQRFRANHASYRDGFIAQPSTRSMGAGRDLYGLRRDGSEFPVEIGLNPMETEQGMMVLGTIVDITERKEAEENLRRSQEQLAGVIGSAMDAIITIDEDQRIVLFNSAAERMFLFPAEDAMGQALDRFIPERFRAAHQQHVQGFGETHVTRRSMGALGALYGLRADGEEFPIEASISQIESDGKKLYTVILRDVSERKRAEEALKEQARILDLAPVLIRDLGGRILFWNKGAEQMYGWTAEEALEKFTHNLLKTEFPRPEEEIKARLLARGHWEGELIHTTKDGRQLVIACHWVLHRDEQGKAKAILEVNNDVTERKQAESEIRRLNEELEQRVADRTAQLQAANKELEAFSYSVSHDLRAPLRHINGFSQALLEDYAEQLDDDGKQHLNEVRSASQEMAKLIDDLLQLARVTRGEMRREEVNLSEMARSVIEELQKINGKRNVTIEIKEGLKARGDKRLLRVMLINLLGNAWKFTSHREDAEVIFGHARQNGESFYFVRDNGAGFDMTYANKLFGAFQRLHSAGEFEGTGIGLATVQRIINRHGGRVWAEGTVNEGASFYFTLPNSKETGDEG